MRKVDTLKDLKAERIRLRQKRLLLEEEIEYNFNALKESFTPVNLVKNGAKMLVNKNHGIVNDVVDMFSDFIMKKIILRKSGFILRSILPLLARNAANNLLIENKPKILSWLGDLILKFDKRKNHNPHYDKGTADIEY